MLLCGILSTLSFIFSPFTDATDSKGWSGSDNIMPHNAIDGDSDGMTPTGLSHQHS